MNGLEYEKNYTGTDSVVIPTLTEIVTHSWSIDGYGKNHTKFKCSVCELRHTSFDDSPCTWLEFNKEPCI